MASATLTAVTGGNFVIGNKKAKIYDATLTASYASGDGLAPSDVGLKSINTVIVTGPFKKSDDSDALAVRWKHSTNQLIAYQGKDPANAGGADVPLQKVGTTDLSAYSGRIIVIGTGTG